MKFGDKKNYDSKDDIIYEKNFNLSIGVSFDVLKDKCFRRNF